MTNNFALPGLLSRWMYLIKTIRSGTQSEQYDLLIELPHITDELCQASHASVQYSYHLRAFHVLLETANDTNMPKAWRTYCADQMYHPMFALQRLSTTPRLRRLTNITLAKTMELRYDS